MGVPRAAAILFAAGAVLGASGTALGKSHLIVPYPFEAAWPGALRFVRVEKGWKVSEQDKEAGFIRFELVEDRKPHAATLEVIRLRDAEERDVVRLQLQANDLARFQEAPILEQLARKLKDELGPPAAPRKKKEPEASKKPAPEEADGGAP
jgi:hypothetical protein